nr:response regulator transcription factor [Bacilli bacterium]
MILLVDDNKEILDGLSFSLKEAGYSVEEAFNINEAKEKYMDASIVILDITLPDGNGFDFYKNYLCDRNIPTIFLTANDSEVDIVKGLELGADDYMTKPFSTKELLVRIKKILMRKENNTVIKIKDIEYDIDKMKLTKNGEDIKLTSIELNILNLLFVSKGGIVRRDAILDKIWELTGNDVDDHTLTVYIKRLKDKIGSDIIINVKGLGYKLYEENK